MTAAPAKPITRQQVPWDPWCWLEVQVATAVGSTGDPGRVGYWQPDAVDTADPRYTVWQADGIPIPPAGGTIPTGYGEWVQGNTGTKWGPNWDALSWRAVDCDLNSASFETGFTPWDWNASPGNGTLRLNDPDHTYFPAGPGSGFFDDIGINTPIRVIAHLTDKFDQVPANAAKRQPDRTLITGVIRSIEHELTPAGTGTTTIHFSEPHVLFGRVDIPETPVGLPGNNSDMRQRLQQLADLSDDALTKMVGTDYNDWYTDGGVGADAWQWPQVSQRLVNTTVSSDLWTEMCKVINSACMVSVLRLYNVDAYTHLNNPYVLPTAVWPPTPPDPGQPTQQQSNRYGTDTRILSPDCSDPAATFNYTVKKDATRVTLSNCPVGSIQFGHNADRVGNKVSISAATGTATVLQDQASIDRWMTHTYQRHDLVLDPTFAIGTATTADVQVAHRYLKRLKDAVFHISDCDYVIAHPRDFDFALGAVPATYVRTDHPAVEPGRWMRLDWGWVTADMHITKIGHQITPSGWTVTHAYEVHNPVTHQEVP